MSSDKCLLVCSTWIKNLFHKCRITICPKNFCPKNFCPKNFCPKNFCPKNFCPKNFCPKNFCPKNFCPKNFCPKNFCPKTFSTEIRIPRTELILRINFSRNLWGKKLKRGQKCMYTYMDDFIALKYHSF
jgi:hypothetical protein